MHGPRSNPKYGLHDDNIMYYIRIILRLRVFVSVCVCEHICICIDSVFRSIECMRLVVSGKRSIIIIIKNHHDQILFHLMMIYIYIYIYIYDERRRSTIGQYYDCEMS